MSPETMALVLIMLSGVEAQHVQQATTDPSFQENANLFDMLVNRVRPVSGPPDEGLDTTMLGKSTHAIQATPGLQATSHLRVPSARLPASSIQPRFSPAASMVDGGMAGMQCVRANILSATIRADAKAPVKKKGVKIVNGKEIPFNKFMPKAPLKAKVIKNVVHPHTLTEDTGDANWETVHVTIDHGGDYPYVEGMSLGLIAPGPDKSGKSPAAVRLYSIASSAVGDDESSNTVSLCVKRVVEVDGKFANREVGEDKPDKAGTAFPDKKVYRGVCSNHICDLKEGDEVLITGPVGTEMLLPEDPESVIVMLATGTGIAPMRSYLRYLFNDKAGANPDGSRKFKGLAWLFLGVPYSKSLLYDDENQEYKEKFPGQYRYEYAISREQKNAAGQKMYIQTRLAEYAEELWDLLQNDKTHIYMCGLKGMESGLAEALSPIAEKNGVKWPEFAKELKKKGCYHVEVY